MYCFSYSSLFVLLAIAATGCIQVTEPLSSTGELKKFNSTAEITEYLGKYTGGPPTGGSGLLQSRQTGGAYSADNTVATMVPTYAPAMKESAAGGGGASPDYSQTNVQVEGVDEADFVKNDGEFIYLLNQGNLVIVDASPADEADIVSTTEIEGNPGNIFVRGDSLVVFSTVTDYAEPGYGREGMPMRTYSPTTHAFFYSVKDRKNPVLVEDYSVDGDYFNARMIGDVVYLITKMPIYRYGGTIEVPVVSTVRSALAPDVYYFDHPEPDYVFHTVTSFDIRAGKEISAKTFLMGYTNTMYMSEENLYISYPQYNTITKPLPPQPVPIGMKVQSVPLPIEEDRFNRMSEEEKQAYLSEMRGEVPAWREVDRTSTTIHKLAADNGKIEYVAKGEVSGSLLSQFSMDENGGNLRVATTSDVSTPRESTTYSNVFVLDSKMKEIGALTHIAPGERIYAARFTGERLYLVTFRQVDPFFVISLADPKTPKVLGKLKLPGFSEYLHPYDANHVIGIGKETASTEWGGVAVQGLKLALFDVSDTANPVLRGKYEIGGSGSDSEALRDHRAFLFDREKNLLVIPVTRYPGSEKPLPAGEIISPYRVWQGAYVFGVTPESGFQLKGRVTHLNESENYPDYSYAVRRALYIGDTLSTISSAKIVMNSLRDVNATIKEIDLPGLDGGYVLSPLPDERVIPGLSTGILFFCFSTDRP